MFLPDFDCVHVL